jgi:NitT/TauT family transport system substrate-binding protein
MLEKHGVGPKAVNDVELPFANMNDAVAAGHVDAAIVTQPFLYFGASIKKIRIVAYHFIEVQPGVQISGFVVSRKWSEKNPRTLAAFARAVAKATMYLKENVEGAKVLVAQFTHVKPEVVEATSVPVWVNELSTENVATQMRLMLKYGLLKKEQDLDAFAWKAGALKAAN